MMRTWQRGRGNCGFVRLNSWRKLAAGIDIRLNDNLARLPCKRHWQTHDDRPSLRARQWRPVLGNGEGDRAGAYRQH